MALKNFVRHTRPKGKKQIQETIEDIGKQIKYETALGHTENFNYLVHEQKYLENKLRNMK